MLKNILSFSLLWTLLILMTNNMAFAENSEPEYKEFVDIVYEWTPHGNMIQIGDFTISKINSVWLDNGGETLSQVGTSYIEQGKPARAMLLEKDANGMWIAEKIIVFSGKGFDNLVKTLPPNQKKVLTGNQ